MLVNILTEHRQQIVGEWFRRIIDTYPANSADFLANQKDQFANPVGSTVSRGIEVLLDEIIGGMNSSAISSGVDGLMRIRSIQDFSASQAAGVIFCLKDSVRALLRDRLHEAELASELLQLESRIDIVALAAFDAYMKCRDSLNEIRFREMKARTAKLTERVAKAGGIDPDEV